jgi:hypothetical protein
MINAGAYEGKISAMLFECCGGKPCAGDRVFLIGTQSFNAVFIYDLTDLFCCGMV